MTLGLRDRREGDAVSDIWAVRTADGEYLIELGAVTYRKAMIGYWIDGRWCPTKAIRDHEIVAARRRRGEL